MESKVEEVGQPMPPSTMMHLNWNCHGMAAAATVRELREFCRSQLPAVVFLMESCAPWERVDHMRRRLKYHDCFSVDPRGQSGGLCLFCTKEVDIQVFQSTPNFIHTAIHFLRGGENYDCTFVYGNPIFHHRKSLWDRLAALQSNVDRAWCCMGDFTEVLSNFEKDGLQPYNASRANLFRDFLNRTGMVDVDFKGCKFTWTSNLREGFVTKEKLDRVIMTWPWRFVFPHALSIALPMVSSDHSPFIVQTCPKNKSGTTFHYEALWEDH